MSQESDKTAPQGRVPPGQALNENGHARGNIFTLEIVFLGVIGLVTLAAFFQALNYKLVSARTPFVIMAPLFILIVLHALRLWRIRHEFHPGMRLRTALAGGNPHLNKVAVFSAWLFGLLAMIMVLGHVLGAFLYCVILMRFLAGESWKMALTVGVAVTLFLYGTFEYLFNIDLYRGLILRWYLGFRDF